MVFLNTPNGIREINDDKHEEAKGHYEFPYGDFKDAHRCGLLTAESHADQYKHYDIENAAAHLHGILDARNGSPASRTVFPGKTPHGARHPVR
jgi:hypothetical protein